MIESIEPIVFDESECHYYTPFNYKTLDFMCCTFGPEVRDTLLISKAVEYVRLPDRNLEYAI